MSNEYDIVQATSKLLEGMAYNLEVVRDSIAKMEESVDTTYFTAAQREEYHRLRDLSGALEQLVASHDRKHKPVKVYGALYKNGNDRYEVEGFELSSGSIVDYYDEDYATFTTSRIEYSHEHGDYFIVSLGRGERIDGVRVRIK